MGSKKSKKQVGKKGKNVFQKHQKNYKGRPEPTVEGGAELFQNKGVKNVG